MGEGWRVVTADCFPEGDFDPYVLARSPPRSPAPSMYDSSHRATCSLRRSDWRTFGVAVSKLRLCCVQIGAVLCPNRGLQVHPARERQVRLGGYGNHRRRLGTIAHIGTVAAPQQPRNSPATAALQPRHSPWLRHSPVTAPGYTTAPSQPRHSLWSQQIWGPLLAYFPQAGAAWWGVL